VSNEQKKELNERI